MTAVTLSEVTRVRDVAGVLGGAALAASIILPGSIVTRGPVAMFLIFATVMVAREAYMAPVREYPRRFMSATLYMLVPAAGLIMLVYGLTALGLALSRLQTWHRAYTDAATAAIPIIFIVLLAMLFGLLVSTPQRIHSANQG